jgi:hypothetical protein
MGGFLTRFLHDLQAAFNDPRADPKQTVLFLGGGVLLVLIVIVALLFFVSDGPPTKRHKDKGPQRSRRRLVRLVVPGVLLVFLGLLVFADQWATSTSTCSRCHEIRPAVASWAKASHAQVSCLACHGEPGVGGWLQTRTRALSNLLTHRLQKAPRPTAANVANSRCLECHTDILRGTAGAGAVRVRHADFLGGDVSCLECHGQVGHGSASTQSNRRPTMDKCLVCHQGTRASADCALCHRRDVAMTRQVPDSYPKAQLAPPTTCDGCHDPAPCLACHKIAMPHPPGWAAAEGHAKAAAFDGKQQLCYRCHAETDCRRCHQPFDSHGADWKTRHAHNTRSADLSCKSCHSHNSAAIYCDLCHTPGQAAGGAG